MNWADKKKPNGRGMCHKHYEARRRKEKKLSWADIKFGPVCTCGKRHVYISSPGHNLPKSSENKCDEKD